ncbi:MAG: universal stress protein [Segetibacter sp.]
MKNILVLTDFSDNAKAAAKYALKLAVEINANVILYNTFSVPAEIPAAGNIVWPLYNHQSLELESVTNLKTQVNELKNELLEKSDIDLSYLLDAGTVTHKLKDIIDENKIWLVVMGTKGEGAINNLLLGSNVFKVLDNINCPVLIISKNAEFSKFRELAYATDLRSSDVNIISWLNQFSEILKVNLSIIHVSNDTITPEEATSKKITEEIVNRTTNSHIYIKYRQGNNIEQSLREIMEENDVGMLGMLYRKHGFFESLFHESQTYKMIKHTKIPILVFPDVL